jgi:phosphoribosylformimino-5-aminoimidazole carboxamide ribotide isomerase
MPFEILPAIDLLDGQCVRLERGDRDRRTVYGSDPAAMARRWRATGCTSLHVVDLNGAFDGTPVNRPHLAAIRDAFDGFIECGGGLRTAEAVDALLDVGIDCAILGTAALEQPQLIGELVARHGANRIAAGVDAKNGFVAVRGWVESGSVAALDLLAELARLGIRRVIYTDIATDGMLTGPNLGAMRAAATHVPEVGIIVSGGVASADDVRAVAAMPEPNIVGVITGRAIYEGRLDLTEVTHLIRA